MRISTIHRRLGFATVIVFLITGFYMKLKGPDLHGSNEVVRFLFRANHVYILLAGLVNLGVGFYVVPHARPWRRNA